MNRRRITKGAICAVLAATMSITGLSINYNSINLKAEKANAEVSKSVEKNGWIKEDYLWYYYTNNIKATGWKRISNKWYFFNSTGVMITGWQNISGKWYFLNVSGVMQTGWQKIDDKWYYFGTGGVMQTGWKQINGKWYYFGTSGAMVTDKWIAGVYYVKANGVMATSEWVDGGKYYVGADGKYIKDYVEIPENNFEIVDEMGLGFNLGKTFAQVLEHNQDEERIKVRIDAAYEAGFKTVRIPVQWTLHTDVNGNVVEDDIIKLLKVTVDYCLEKDMYVILGSMGDLGEDETSHWDLPDVKTESFKNEYTNMWTDIAKMFEECDYHLVFEAYNEVKNTRGTIMGFGYDYSGGTSRADSYYFAGRCENLSNMLKLNSIFGGIMKEVAPERYYMISSYNADTRSAYSDYTNITWENAVDHNVNGEGKGAYFTINGVDETKAIYNCHIYLYGTDFVGQVDTLQAAFEERGINIPIYVNENGTHTVNIGTTEVNQIFVKPVEYMCKTMKSGLCLWDDTQSMSYLNIGEKSWYNDNLIKAMVSASK